MFYFLAKRINQEFPEEIPGFSLIFYEEPLTLLRQINKTSSYEKNR